MKTNEELNALKNEVETLNARLAELSEEELVQVAGGSKKCLEILVDGKVVQPNVKVIGLVKDYAVPGNIPKD